MLTTTGGGLDGKVEKEQKKYQDKDKQEDDGSES